MMTMPQSATAIIVSMASLVGIVRLVLWRRANGPALSGKLWRFVALMILQLACTMLLYFTLFPPLVTQPSGTLHIATGSTPRASLPTGGPNLIALPEAGRPPGAQAVPDLATALRRHPGTPQIVIHGSGLVPRDVDAVKSVEVVFSPPPARQGIIALSPPAAVAPGASFKVSGEVARLPQSRVELVDPAGRITDSATPGRSGIFTLFGTTRAPGAVEFTLRLRDGPRVIEQAKIPIIVERHTKPRLLIGALAPGAEVKYLRRWASDAGFDVVTQMQAGGGVTLGDPPISLDAATLSRFDAAIFDDRSWTALGARRGQILSAVENGLGLVLRPSGMLDADMRGGWQSLGFTLKGGNDIAPLSLPPLRDRAIEATRVGTGTADQPVDIALPNDPLPDLSRLALVPGGSNVAPLLQDGSGTTIAAWRPRGVGRVALFTPIDSYALLLTGRRTVYEGWWSDLLSTVLRPTPGSRSSRQIIWVGERASFCEIQSDNAAIRDPTGRISRIVRSASCGAYWPQVAGWHQLIDGNEVRSFFVQTADALPALRAARDTQATQMLVNATMMHDVSKQEQPLAEWPFALLWLLASALLWWLERTRIGRPAPPQPAM